MSGDTIIVTREVAELSPAAFGLRRLDPEGDNREHIGGHEIGEAWKQIEWAGWHEGYQPRRLSDVCMAGVLDVG